MARHVHREDRAARTSAWPAAWRSTASANGRLLREGPFDDIWIQPAAGDAGGALGVALVHLAPAARQPAGRTRHATRMHGALLGPAFTDDAIERVPRRSERSYRPADRDERCLRGRRLLADGKVVGWFQGRMEFGPRALGARSILGDPRGREMQATMNLKIKFRESFRPFAPAVLRDGPVTTSTWTSRVPYMLLVRRIREERRSGHERRGAKRLWASTSSMCRARTSRP